MMEGKTLSQKVIKDVSVILHTFASQMLNVIVQNSETYLNAHNHTDIQKHGGHITNLFVQRRSSGLRSGESGGFANT